MSPEVIAGIVACAAAAISTLLSVIAAYINAKHDRLQAERNRKAEAIQSFCNTYAALYQNVGYGAYHHFVGALYRVCAYLPEKKAADYVGQMLSALRPESASSDRTDAVFLSILLDVQKHKVK